MDKSTLLKNKVITPKGKINPHFTRKVKLGDLCAISTYNEIIKETRFLADDCDFKDRIYCIVNNVYSCPKCHHCGTPTKLQYHHDTKSFRFTKFCSTACSVHYRDEDLILQTRKETNKRLYGDENPMNVPEIRDKQIRTAKQRYQGRHPKQSHFSDNAFAVLNDRDCLLDMHHNKKMSMNAISYILGVNDQTVARYFDKHNIKKLNFTRSMGEIQLCEFLDSLGEEYITNDRSIIGKEIDIFLPAHNLAIEYCGLYWHADFNRNITKYSHKDKQQLCEQKGIQLLTIFEDEWKNKRSIVINKLLYLLRRQQQSSIYARNTKIISVDSNSRKAFFNKYHIQGDGRGSITYGLTFNDDLIACMTFIKQHNGCYILNRYATSVNVVGGFTKLLSHFERTVDWTKLITFADLRWSSGKLYESTGWKIEKRLPPDYCYVDTNNNSRIHKFNFRRKYLHKRLNSFDPSLSERVNCDLNGIPRLWDCGKIRYVKFNDKSS